MTPRSKWLTARKKVFVSCLIAAVVYFIITFILIHFNVLSSRELSAGTTSSATLPKGNLAGKLNYKTTTTTTPTPFIFFTNVNNLLTPKVLIEKFDAMKVHSDIMKRKISRLSGNHPNKQKSPSIIGEYLVSNLVHMFYSNSFYTGNKKEKVNWRLKNSNATYKVIKQNLDAARKVGAGVIFVTCSRLSNSLISQTSRVHSTLKLLFHLGPKYGLKVGIAIRDYTKRNVMSIRRDIRIFTSMYGKEKALFRIKRDKLLQPLVYILGSFAIASEEWSEVLSPKGKFTIRNTKIDSFVLGELQDEEHSSHIRLSHFDGFFTPGSANGDVFGSTWKNWQSLSGWSQEKNLLWSAGIVEVSSGLPAVGVALRTALRCRPRPSFVSFTNVPLMDEYFALTQTWLKKWSNSSIHDV